MKKILQTWKRYSARKINLLTGSTGPLWQEEPFDRINRDDEHLARTIDYTGNNPRKAGLAADTYVRWIRPQVDQARLGLPRLPLRGPRHHAPRLREK